LGIREYFQAIVYEKFPKENQPPVFCWRTRLVLNRGMHCDWFSRRRNGAKKAGGALP
jgi:hypothetical protein